MADNRVHMCVCGVNCTENENLCARGSLLVARASCPVSVSVSVSVYCLRAVEKRGTRHALGCNCLIGKVHRFGGGENFKKISVIRYPNRWFGVGGSESYSDLGIEGV